MGTAISCTECSYVTCFYPVSRSCSKTAPFKDHDHVINVQMDDCVHECTEALVVQKVRIIVGASLSEINTSVTSLHTCMCMLMKEWVDSLCKDGADARNIR